jgi:hypothetical protein
MHLAYRANNFLSSIIMGYEGWIGSPHFEGEASHPTFFHLWDTNKPGYSLQYFWVNERAVEEEKDRLKWRVVRLCV